MKKYELLLLDEKQLSQKSFPVSDFDDTVLLTFYCGSLGKKHSVYLSLKKSFALIELIKSGQISYEELSKRGVDKYEYLIDENKESEYRYTITYSEQYDENYIIFFNFLEYREYYSVKVLGVFSFRKRSYL